MKQAILLMTLIFFSRLNAATLTVNQETYTTNEKIVVDFSEMEVLHKDWIGIYAVGSSTAWRNVRKWRWTNDKVKGQVIFDKLPTGHYEVRAFYNNSYVLEAKKTFTVIKGNTLVCLS